ncbi:hypothetical protein Plhal304r1_c012g0047951 [Plasmopara halstedii]
MSCGAIPSSSEQPLLPAATLVNPENTVEVFVADFNGVALPVMVPVETKLVDLLDAAFKRPTFESFLGFEDVNLRLDDPVTAADATRWTADEPLRLKFKRPRYTNEVLHNGWNSRLLVGAANFCFTMWTDHCHYDKNDDCNGSENMV